MANIIIENKLSSVLYVKYILEIILRDRGQHTVST